MSVKVAGSGSARYNEGIYGSVVKFLRTPHVDVNFDFRSWAKHNVQTKHWSTSR